MDRRDILIRNALLSVGVLVVAIVALTVPGIEGQYRAAIVTGALTYLAGLWTHSGRRRRSGGGGLADSLPPVPPMPSSVLLLLLLTGACNVGGSGGVHLALGDAPAPTAGTPLNADQINLATQSPGSIACPSGKVCVGASSTSGRLYSIDSSGTGLNFGDARGFRVLSGAPSGAAGDVYYNSSTGKFAFYSGGSFGPLPKNSGGLGLDVSTGLTTGHVAYVDGGGALVIGAMPAAAVAAHASAHRASGSDDLLTSPGAIGGGTPAAVTGTTITANTSVALAANANLSCSSGSTAVDLSLGTGTFKTTTGAHTIGGSVTFAANKGIAYTSGTGAADFSNGSGAFKTTTGAVTIGPGAVGVSGDVTLSTTKTLAAGANTLVSGDKLQAAQLAIGSQATGDLLYADSSTSWARLGAGTSGYPLLSGGAGFSPAWAQIGSAGISGGTLVYATITGGAKGALGAATGYLVGPGVAWTTSTEHALYVATRAATVRSLYCNLGTAPGGTDTVGVTVRKNGSDQTTTVNYTGTDSGDKHDTVHTFSVAAGDRVTIKGVSTAGTAADLTCSLEAGN